MDWGQRVLICKTEEFGFYSLCNREPMENFRQGNYTNKFVYWNYYSSLADNVERKIPEAEPLVYPSIFI